VAIAKAVAGRFDHYICRRDDNLRNRAADEVPRIQAQALRAAGVAESAISIIPDEQDAIDAALRMGESGDLLLVFADALVRSWKQITKFKPISIASATPAPRTPRPILDTVAADKIEAAAASPEFNMHGLIRDERGVRLAPESDD
jgi:cyanophycin synthetase